MNINHNPSRTWSIPTKLVDPVAGAPVDSNQKLPFVDSKTFLGELSFHINSANEKWYEVHPPDGWWTGKAHTEGVPVYKPSQDQKHRDDGEIMFFMQNIGSQHPDTVPYIIRPNKK